MSHQTPHLVPSIRHADERSSAPSAQRSAVKSASDADIAKRAYEKYEARGRIHGFHEQDWTAASRELITEAFDHPSSPSLSPSVHAS
jgi:hypothetical protein